MGFGCFCTDWGLDRGYRHVIQIWISFFQMLLWPQICSMRLRYADISVHVHSDIQCSQANIRFRHLILQCSGDDVLVSNTLRMLVWILDVRYMNETFTNAAVWKNTVSNKVSTAISEVRAHSSLYSYECHNVAGWYKGAGGFQIFSMRPCKPN